MNPAISIRPARPSDAIAAASLIHLAMGEYAEFFAGDAEPEKLLAALFVRTGNRFSYSFGTVIESDSEAAGLLLAYPAAKMGSLDLGTGRHLLSLLGFRRMARLAWKMIPMTSVREAERGEFYVSTLAVRPAFQGRGFGARLMSCAEEQARGSGLKRCSLIVDARNEVALRLYQKIGYKIVFSGKHKSDYHRMVKELA